MKINRIVDLYSLAFFDLSCSVKGFSEKALNHTEELLDFFQNEDNLIWKFLVNLNDNDLRFLIHDIFASRVDPYFFNFLQILLDDRVFRYLLSILKKLKKLFLQKLNFKFAKIYSKVELNKKQLMKIHQILSRLFNCKIKINSYQDLELIAGVRLEIDQFSFDNSLSKKLKNLNENLLSLNE